VRQLKKVRSVFLHNSEGYFHISKTGTIVVEANRSTLVKLRTSFSVFADGHHVDRAFEVQLCHSTIKGIN